MKDVHIIYNNEVGVAFVWDEATVQHSPINIIFNSTVLHFSEDELVFFSEHIQRALKAPFTSRDDSHTCKSIILQTPFKQVSFAINYAELLAVEDLVKGTLFEMELHTILHQVL